jgi:predicted signal transduction protein with EAL and GGDEF domain
MGADSKSRSVHPEWGFDPPPAPSSQRVTSTVRVLRRAAHPRNYYLKNFPFDYLKIDGDFIRGVATSPMDQLVVKAIVSIARGIGKKTVAEFVADEETSCLLREIGVDFAQGYHIGVPRPVSELLQTAGPGLT